MDEATRLLTYTDLDVYKRQSVVEGTKFADTWSVEVNAGAITPLTHSAFFKNAGSLEQF